ncbi:hypothetical protein C2I18_15370 [Paenibacillus sp. PK3_47]|uniref:hypothetical protein n=1 Tax=Paenibacillus sp. PK3_47 TaxID=2072642 RepID=UPI00201DA860|nr:hypothetical protein [Paenibacillus sp. PK3_47]UQZ34782.1 hypothetical protein C2I18_15370 [Paenibacillus sp. PK3_47]
MKKHSLLTSVLLAALGLTSILGTPVQAAPAAGASSATSHAAAVYKAGLPLFATSAKLPEAIKYLNSNIYALTPYQATVLTLKLENLHKAALPAWESRFDSSQIQRKLAAVYKAEVSMAKLAESTGDKALRALIQSAGAHGYKLETAEGSFFPVIDYSAYRKYKLYVTEDIADYITIMAAESDLPPSKDNGLVIGWTDVADRALSQEKFIQQHPKSNRITAVKSLYASYVLNTFYGQNNTPLFHYETLEMDLEAQKAYNSILAKNNDNSPFLQNLEGLMKILKQNGYKLDSEVEQYLKKKVPLS